MGVANSRQIYFVAALFGLATFVIVYGPGQLLGTNAYWQLPQADERMALMGYRYFLHDTWHWPLFVNQTVNVPYPLLTDRLATSGLTIPRDGGRSAARPAVPARLAGHAAVVPVQLHRLRRPEEPLLGISARYLCS